MAALHVPSSAGGVTVTPDVDEKTALTSNGDITGGVVPVLPCDVVAKLSTVAVTLILVVSLPKGASTRVSCVKLVESTCPGVESLNASIVAFLVTRYPMVCWR